ncbi:hypothetical protein AAVH_12006 [Aphelenchoides avenae]|nr:hypothetical protein AAVH_12006 [Aphelenchus avenae]
MSDEMKPVQQPETLTESNIPANLPDVDINLPNEQDARTEFHEAHDMAEAQRRLAGESTIDYVH